MVLLAHLKQAFAITLEQDSYQWLYHISGSAILAKMINSFLIFSLDGKLAVQVFWFMSGYVLSLKLFEKDGWRYLQTAFLKRYFRLALPAAASVLLAYVLLQAGMMYNARLAERMGAAYAGWNEMYAFAPNFGNALRSAFWDTFFAFSFRTAYNPILWTMGPELFGSFICFLLFALFQYRKGRYLFFAALLLLAVLFQYYWVLNFVLGYWLCDARARSVRFNKRIRPLAALFSRGPFWLLAGLLLVWTDGFFQQYYIVFAQLLVSVAGVGLVMYSRPLQAFFGKPFPVWLGKISFGLYLVHIPLICSFSCYMYLHCGGPGLWAGLLTAVTSSILITGIACFFTILVDQPSIRLAGRIGNFLQQRTRLLWSLLNRTT